MGINYKHKKAELGEFLFLSLIIDHYAFSRNSITVTTYLGVIKCVCKRLPIHLSQNTPKSSLVVFPGTKTKIFLKRTRAAQITLGVELSEWLSEMESNRAHFYFSFS